MRYGLNIFVIIMFSCFSNSYAGSQAQLNVIFSGENVSLIKYHVQYDLNNTLKSKSNKLYSLPHGGIKSINLRYTVPNDSSSAGVVITAAKVDTGSTSAWLSIPCENCQNKSGCSKIVSTSDAKPQSLSLTIRQDKPGKFTASCK